MIHLRELSVSDIEDFILGERSIIENDLRTHEASMLVMFSDQEKQFRFMGCFEGEEMVGFMVIADATNSLCRIYVSREHRRKGYAETMVNSETIKSLMCFTDNTEAMSLYSKLGFVPLTAESFMIQILTKE